MDDSSPRNEEEEIIIDITPVIRLYKSGRVVRMLNSPPVPPSVDPKTGVKSKDINISTKTGVYVRLFKPSNLENPNYQNKISLLLYFHGGGFCLESTFSAMYHNYLNGLASKAQVMIVSVEYRKAPEHRLPAAYHDCWDALNWVISGNSKEAWLEEHVDFSRIYLMGDSAGANIAHYLALRVGIEGLGRGRVFHISGIILAHPFFWGEQRIGAEAASKRGYLSVPGLVDKVWAIARPTTSSSADHPWMNPSKDPRLSSLGCKRVLIFVAQKDYLRDRGVYYKEALEKSGWQGTVELVESKGEDHVFHLLNPSSASSADVMRKIVSFLYPARCAL